MAPTAIRRHGAACRRRLAPAALLAALCALDLGTGPARGAGGAAGQRFLFTATHAGGAASPQVLLKWTAVDKQKVPPAYERFLLKRRGPADPGPTDYATVEGLHDTEEIEAVFPPGSEIRVEIEELFVANGYAPDLASALLALRDDTSPARVMQRQLLLDANHGVAIAEGQAFLDTDLVGGARYLYELWGLDDLGIAVERLGKIWVLGGADTILPKTELLEVVPVADTDDDPQGNFPEDEDVDLDGDGRLDTADWGDGKIHLRWKPPLGHAKDRESRPTGFGFDIYRDLKGGVACPPAPAETAVKVNRWPVFGLSATKGDLPDFFFVDDNANPGIPALLKGTEYCYWLVARNFLRQPGTPSDPAVACVPDLGSPKQVRDVKTVVAGANLTVTWTPNADDPPTVVGQPYVDDTVAYNVYRFTDASRVLGRPDPDDRVATALPASATAWTDSAPGGPADNPGKIFWYSVTAADTARCGRPANQSPHSAPARAIIYDTTPPEITTVSPFCGNESCQNPQNPRCCRDCSQTPPIQNAGWCLAGGASGLWPLRGDPWGYRVPSDGTDSDDTMSVRLYRGSKGADFKPVEEAFRPQGGTGDWVLLEPAFQPRVSQKIDYRLRALDFDSNVGASVAPHRTASVAPMPAFLRGDPPPRPTVVRTLPEAGGGVRVRWHAPGASALAGFLVRVGPEDDPEAGDFFDLPQIGLPPVSNFIHETAIDTDFPADGISPYDIIIKDSTVLLADLPGKGGLEAAGGFFEHVFTKEDDEVIEIYSVDIAGQLSEKAIAPAPNGAPDFTPPWPARAVGSFEVEAQFVDTPPEAIPGDRIELCWTQTFPAGRCTAAGGGGTVSCDSDADCPAGSFCDETRDPAPYVAIFRAIDDAGAVDRYQQRSPRLKIHAYLPDTLSHHCLCSSLGFTDSATTACWQDWSTSPGVTYKYSVQRFWGPPDPGESRRSEGEIHSAGVPVTVAR